MPERAWILLPSGKQLDLLDPDPWAWTDDDLAIGLSRTYRWAEIQARAAVLVLAGAGTGETRTLTGAVAHRITEAGITPGRLVAVTFTNKAAREMAERIRQSLGQGPLPSWIGTFHGLAARQLRIEPEVAGLRPGFDILDADDSRRMLKRTLKALNVGGGEETAPVGRDPLKVMCEEALMHARVPFLCEIVVAWRKQAILLGRQEDVRELQSLGTV